MSGIARREARLRQPMKLHRSTWLGVLIGLAVAAAVLVFVERGKKPPPRWPEAGPLLSDCDGQMRELVIQYTARSAKIAAPTYAAFLPLLPADVTVRVVCPARSDYDDLMKRVGEVKCRTLPVCTGHPMTCWSRDRWLALSPLEPGGPATLLCPAAEDAQEAWQEREGDARVAGDLAKAFPKQIKSFRSRLLFDGGDFVCDSETAFVNPSVIQRNIPSVVRNEKELVDELAQLLKRKIVLLRKAPRHHTEMFMTLLPGKLALVGDPYEGVRLAHQRQETLDLMSETAGEPDESEAIQKSFDTVALACSEAGYRVVRLPLLAGRGSRAWMSYANVVVDNRDGKTIVYMPVYTGAEVLNETAEEIWRECGVEVRRVDCTSAFASFGSLHCLVSIMAR